MKSVSSLRGRSDRALGLLVVAAVVVFNAPAARAASSAPATASGPTYEYGDVPDSDGNGSYVLTPTKIPALAGVPVVAVSNGNFVTLVLTSAGKLYSSGYNYYGQLGNGTTTDNFTLSPAVLPAGTSKIVKVVLALRVATRWR